MSRVPRQLRLLRPRDPGTRAGSAMATGFAVATAAALVLSMVLGSIALAAVGPSIAVTVGYRDGGYGGALASRPTSDPEESKLWYNDGAWWGDLFVSSGSGSGGSHFNISKFNTATHSRTDTTTAIDIRDLSHGDYFWDGVRNRLYVVSSKSICTAAPSGSIQPCNDEIRVFRYSYNNGSGVPLAGRYTIDSGFFTLATPTVPLKLGKPLIGGLYGPTNGAPFTGGGSNAVTGHNS